MNKSSVFSNKSLSSSSHHHQNESVLLFDAENDSSGDAMTLNGYTMGGGSHHHIGHLHNSGGGDNMSMDSCHGNIRYQAVEGLVQNSRHTNTSTMPMVKKQHHGILGGRTVTNDLSNLENVCRDSLDLKINTYAFFIFFRTITTRVWRISSVTKHTWSIIIITTTTPTS